MTRSNFADVGMIKDLSTWSCVRKVIERFKDRNWDSRENIGLKNE